MKTLDFSKSKEYIASNGRAMKKTENGSLFSFLVVICIALCGCGNVSVNSENNSKSNNIVDYSAEVATIPDTVIFCKKEVSVTISNLTRDTFEFTVKNDGEKDIMFMIDDVAVNNCVVFDEECFSKYVTPGNYISGTFNINGFGAYGGGNVKTLDIKASVTIYGDDYDTNHMYGHILTSLDDGNVYTPKLEPLIAYEDENFALGLIKESNSINDMYFFIENKSDHYLEVDFSYMSANGQMFDIQPISWLNVFPLGCVSSQAQYSDSYTIYSAFDEEVKKKGFDNITKLASDLNVFLKDETGEKIDSYDLGNVVIYEE